MTPSLTLEWNSILPWLVLSATIVVSLVTDLCVKEGKKEWVGGVAMGGLVLTGICILVSCWGREVIGFNGMVSSDPLSLFLDLLILLCAAFALLLSFQYVEREGIQLGEYYILLLISTLGMMVMVHAINFIVLFVGLEILSLPLYILCGLRRNRAGSIEAALKYFLLGSFASALFLFGVAWLYVWTGSTQIVALRSFTSPLFSGSLGFWFAVSLIWVGLAFKIAAAPFHMWVPDVYEGAPTSITAFMAAGVKVAAIGVVVRMAALIFPFLAAVDWKSVFWVLAALSMVVGNGVAVAQTNIKRMLAYSSIAHAGYLLVGLTAANAVGFTGILFYLFVYALMTFGSFGVVIAFGEKGDEKLCLEDYIGMGWKRPFLGFAMIVVMFSLAGLPPTAGFIGKFYLFSGAVEAGYPGLAVLGVLTSVVSAFYYLRVLMYMYMKETPSTTAPHGSSLVLTPGDIAVLLSIVGLLCFGIFPSKLLALVQKTVTYLL